MPYRYFNWGLAYLTNINEQTIIIYLVLINTIAIILFGMDKKAAQSGVWRISERNLFLAAILGGAPGGLLAMYLFRHKTRKLKFVIGLPLIILLQLAVIYFLL